MNRRKFIQKSAVAAVASALALKCERTEHEMVDIKTQLIRQNDALIPQLTAKLEKNPNHKWHGGMMDEYGIFTAGGTAGFIRDATCAVLSPESGFYQSEELQQQLENSARFLLNRQHDDGTIDLHTTNFHSTPDTGFVLEWICGALGLLQKNKNASLASMQSMLQQFVLKAADALTVGGIHTPNHRWVVCMALARVNSLFPNEKYVSRIDEWLGEHIDIDADGQFTEKSSSIYSPLTDRCLITVARLTNRNELYEPVRKNLDMTLYYIHPNGEVVTEASKRQDKYKYGSLASYYYPYRYMALLDSNGQFSAMSFWIEQHPEKLTSFLMYLLEDKKLNSELPGKTSLPANYEKLFVHSNLARFRRGNVSATILADNFTLFHFRKGEAILQALRFASAFFGKGQFKGESLNQVDGAYTMLQKLDGPYYQPFPKDEIPGDGDWEKMEKEKRAKSEIQELESTVTVREESGAFEIDIDITGTDRVPVAIELAFRHGGRLTGVEPIADIKNAYFLKGEKGCYTFQNQRIEFETGRHKHRWTQLRGAEDKLDAMCVYVTDYTPFTWTLRIS